MQYSVHQDCSICNVLANIFECIIIIYVQCFVLSIVSMLYTYLHGQGGGYYS